MKLTFDIETDGLLLQCTQVFCLIAEDIDTGQMYTFTDHDSKYPPISDGLDFLARADALIGHNILGFDLPALDKIYGWKYDGKKFDTLTISRFCVNRRRHPHSLAGWGEKFEYPKFEFSDFTKYTDEMREYCARDVKLNTKVYKHLLKEIAMGSKKNDYFRQGLRVEHDITAWNGYTHMRGWKFDVALAKTHLKTLEGLMKAIEDRIEPSLPPIVKFKDKEPKTPKYTKAGWFTATTAKMLSEYLGRTVTAEEGKTLQIAQFQRKTSEPMRLGNLNELKVWLLEQGWKPDEYNGKMVDGKWITTGPKLTTDSLHKLGDLGIGIDQWTTYRNRRSIIEGWLDVQIDGRLHGDMFTMGTNTYRCSHKVIANLPKVDALFGKELRELFIAEPGNVIVGADSASNQFRALCHYVRDAELTEQTVNGDIHEYNASLLGVPRKAAKSWIYAYLFGAGNAKLGKVLAGVSNAQKGKASRDMYSNAIPGLKKLNEKLQQQWKQTGGYIFTLDGRKVQCGKDYQTLNYLLQSAEAVTCKAAVSWAMDEIKRRGIPAEPRLFYHDEQAWEVPEEHAEEVKEILEESFYQGPLQFGVTIMAGDGSIGKTYADAH